ncbi:anthrone oxygenase family protein [Actinomadura hibisca]|uniref:anthrone oxygenase family protein n=1 Tax=Actinomadura hibisca TaxID=68565 RepID=UPI0008306C68|nr:anthrone oxygenase family protein [Actinomadura hibisca]
MKTALTAVSAALTFLTAAGMTGVFFAFSTSVMPGLNAVRPAVAVESMQHMNRKILNPLFLVSFTGAPALAALTGVLLLALLHHRTAGLLFLAAAAVYAVGAFLPTVAVNVPLNNVLDAVRLTGDPAEAARIWQDYAPRWTAWNHLRGAASATALLLAAYGAYLWGRAS